MATKPKFSICSGILIAGLSFSLATGVYGQKIPENRVVVTTDIKPKLADAVKIPVKPLDERIPVKKIEMNYTTDAYLMVSPVYKSKLKAVTIGAPKIPPLQHSFVKGAFGNYSNLFGEVFYNSKRDRTNMFSADLKHVSGTGPDKFGDMKVGKSGFSTNSIDLFGSHVFNAKYNLSGAIGFQRDANHFYAVIPDSLKPKNISDYQRFNDFHARVNFENGGADTGKLRYNFGLGYYSFADYYKTAENDVTVMAKLDEPISTNHLVADASYDFMNYKTERSLNRTLLKINLAYELKTGIFRAHLGFKTATESDSPTNVFHFYPDIKVEADLIEKYLTVFGGITGGLDKTTFKSFACENPFIVSDPSLKNVNDKFELYGGFKGSFSSNSSFLLSAALKNYRNMFFYLQDTIDRRKFVMVYDTGITTLINLHGELSWNFMEDLDLGTKIDFNSYTVSNLKYGKTTLPIQRPFERPAFTWMLTGNYNIDNKISFGTDVFFVSGREATDLSEKQITKLKPFIDLNLHASYAFTNIPGFKAFLEINNLFGNTYQVWNNYPVRGFQILGGAMYSFL
jgi:hypothetical protein